MATPTRWGDEFLVNEITAFDQGTPSLAVLEGGQFVVVYTDNSATTSYGGTDASQSAIRAQVFDADGSLAIGPFQVNSVTSGNQRNAEVIALDGGGFAVAYEDESNGADSAGDDPDAAIRLQIYASGGSAVGPALIPYANTAGAQTLPDLAQLSTGEILTVFRDESTAFTDPDVGVLATLTGPDGTVLGGGFEVNTTVAGVQGEPRVAVLAGTDRIVVTYDSGDDIKGRIVDRTGTSILGEFTVNTTTASSQVFSDVAALDRGGFVVAWSDGSGLGSDTSDFGIRAQVFRSDGTTLGAEIEVNTATSFLQYQPKVLGLSDGRFVVAWTDSSQGVDTGGDDSSAGAVRAQLFRANGAKDGAEFLVNTVTTGTQADVTLGETPDGRLVVAYMDTSFGVETGSDDTTAAVRATIFELREGGQTWEGGIGDEQYAGTRWRDNLYGMDGNDTLFGAGGNDRLSGGAGEDRLEGDTGWDRLWGGSGNDRLSGGGHGDLLRGGTGADILEGEAGRDKLWGGDGGDAITGGQGRDLMWGGQGYDIFVFLDETDSGTRWRSRDQIRDFRPNVDLIDLSRIDARPLTFPDEAFDFIGRTAFSGTIGELRLARSRRETVVQADLDGDGRSDFEIALSGRMRLDADDFIL